MRTHAKDLAAAKDRVEKAKRYAEACPDFIFPSDEKYQTLEWQLAYVKRFDHPNAPKKE